MNICLQIRKPDALSPAARDQTEPFTEASCMADYLVKRGIDSGRIILEDKSTTTAQNLTNSMKLISADTINHALDSNTTNTVGILTNDFHMFRAMQIARAQKIPKSLTVFPAAPRKYICRTICSGNILQKLNFS